MSRGTYYAQKVVPCDCGSREPYWHGPMDGRREYCCDECWYAASESERALHLAAAQDAARKVRS